MPQIGPMEILVVGVLALIVFGPQRLPEIARSVGKAIAEFKRQASALRDEFETNLDVDVADEPAHAVPENPDPSLKEGSDGPVDDRTAVPAAEAGHTGAPDGSASDQQERSEDGGADSAPR